MKFEGTIRANLLSAITSARRWRGRAVHRDTIAYWNSILEQGRRSNTEPLSTSLGELVVELEGELALTKKH